MGSVLKWGVLILIVVWLWPVFPVCAIACSIFWVVQAIYKNSRDKKEKIMIESVVGKGRVALHKDWEMLIVAIVELMRQHWDTLEDKFEQCIDEDDYGNNFIDDSFSKELMYFTHKVVEPVINKLIDDEKVRANSFALLPSSSAILEDLYDIKYKDSSAIIAGKYIQGTLKAGNSKHIDDNLIYNIYKDDATLSIDNNSNNPSNKASLCTVVMGGALQANNPMRVTHLSGVIFSLFYAMYNSRPSASTETKLATASADFTGNNPYKYEEYIKKILHDRNFAVKKTRASGDYGVDVLARKRGRSFAIQCKLFNRPVGIKAVQEIVSGRMYYKADYAIVVSNNSFTSAAKNMARRVDVLLVHHKSLLNQMEYLTFDDNTTIEVDERAVPPNSPVDQKSRRQSRRNADDLITMILPTTTNNN